MKRWVWGERRAVGEPRRCGEEWMWNGGRGVQVKPLSVEPTAERVQLVICCRPFQTEDESLAVNRSFSFSVCLSSNSSLQLVLGLPVEVLISTPVGLIHGSTELSEFCSKPWLVVVVLDLVPGGGEVHRA